MFVIFDLFLCADSYPSRTLDKMIWISHNMIHFVVGQSDQTCFYRSWGVGPGDMKILFESVGQLCDILMNFFSEVTQ